MTGVVAALLIGAAGTGSAAGYNWDQPLVPSEKKNINDNRDFSAQRTDGGSFLEINAEGDLIYWTRSGESFVSQQRGTNWQNSRLITSLDASRFIEVTGDNRLVLWKWNGSFYTAKQIGTNWGPARLLTGIESGAFLEINDQGLLRRWDIDTQNEIIVGAEQIGSDWDETRAIAGKDYVDFIEIKGTNAVSEWYDFVNDGRTLTEIQFEGADFTDVRLIVGTDFYHFLVILQDGKLYEFTLGADGFYYQALRGQDWNNTRLLG